MKAAGRGTDVEYVVYPQLERPEQEHPSREDSSAIYVGVATTLTANASGHIIVGSGFGASGTYTAGAVKWLPVGPRLVASIRDIDLGERLSPPPLRFARVQVAPATKKHLANPSTRKAFGARRGRRGRP
jgi:hypothetical protein